MRALLTGLSIGCSLLAGTAASAATVVPVNGEVSVNQGKGFEKLTTAFEAKAGDAVMVSPGGSAKVAYPDGCAVQLNPGAVMVIAALSPCASGSTAQEGDQNNNDNNDNKIGTALAVGGAAGAAGFVIYEMTQNGQGQNNNNQGKPASP